MASYDEDEALDYGGGDDLGYAAPDAQSSAHTARFDEDREDIISLDGDYGGYAPASAAELTTSTNGRSYDHTDTVLTSPVTSDLKSAARRPNRQFSPGPSSDGPRRSARGGENGHADGRRRENDSTQADQDDHNTPPPHTSTPPRSELPAGWAQRNSRDGGHPYYFHAASKKSFWDLAEVWAYHAQFSADLTPATTTTIINGSLRDMSTNRHQRRSSDIDRRGSLQSAEDAERPMQPVGPRWGSVVEKEPPRGPRFARPSRPEDSTPSGNYAGGPRSRDDSRTNLGDGGQSGRGRGAKPPTGPRGARNDVDSNRPREARNDRRRPDDELERPSKLTSRAGEDGQDYPTGPRQSSTATARPQKSEFNPQGPRWAVPSSPVVAPPPRAPAVEEPPPANRWGPRAAQKREPEPEPEERRPAREDRRRSPKPQENLAHMNPQRLALLNGDKPQRNERRPSPFERQNENGPKMRVWGQSTGNADDRNGSERIRDEREQRNAAPGRAPPEDRSTRDFRASSGRPSDEFRRRSPLLGPEPAPEAGKPDWSGLRRRKSNDQGPSAPLPPPSVSLHQIRRSAMDCYRPGEDPARDRDEEDRSRRQRDREERERLERERERLAREQERIDREREQMERERERDRALRNRSPVSRHDRARSPPRDSRARSPIRLGRATSPPHPSRPRSRSPPPHWGRQRSPPPHMRPRSPPHRDRSPPPRARSPPPRGRSPRRENDYYRPSSSAAPTPASQHTTDSYRRRNEETPLRRRLDDVRRVDDQPPTSSAKLDESPAVGRDGPDIQVALPSSPPAVHENVNTSSLMQRLNAKPASSSSRAARRSPSPSADVQPSSGRSEAAKSLLIRIGNVAPTPPLPRPHDLPPIPPPASISIRGAANAKDRSELRDRLDVRATDHYVPSDRERLNFRRSPSVNEIPLGNKRTRPDDDEVVYVGIADRPLRDDGDKKRRRRRQ